MSLETVLPLATGIGVGLGVVIHFARQRRLSAALGEKIFAALREEESLALPDLVTRVGMRDGFLNRGKVINVINPFVASGQILQDEPPGTTVRNRLSVLRFRLARR
jgi:hypothetical protein